MAEARVERRLAAILATDIAGYSRLMGVDEEGTLAALKACRRELIDPKIAEHRGRTVKLTGDGALVEFASAVDAVRCAVDIQRSMAGRNAGIPEDRRIEFRIGINVGDIIIDNADIYGDGVNIAARVETLARPGGVCLSDTAYQQIKGKLALDISDMGEQELKNIAQPVRVHGVRLHDAMATATRQAPVQSAPRFSIVVLPFTNMSNDPEQDYFIDGLIEDLTTDLGSITGSFVIARNTAFTYKGKPVDVRQVGRDLNVRYVLEGSARKLQNSMRINAQLIDAESGAHLWADRFDGDIGNLAALSEEVTARLARALSLSMVDAEARRASRTLSPDALDLVLRGNALMNRPRSRENSFEARKLFEAAYRLDADNFEALTGLAWIDVDTFRFGWSETPIEGLARADEEIDRALILAPNHATAHWIKGEILVEQGKADEALAAFDACIAIDRNHSPAHDWRGYAKVFVGRAEETEADVLRAIRLSPKDPRLAIMLGHIGFAKLHLGKLDDAIARVRQALAVNPKMSLGLLYLASAYGLQGDLDKARAALVEHRRAVPGYSIAKYRLRRISKNSVFLEQNDRFIEGLRKAGLPER